MYNVYIYIHVPVTDTIGLVWFTYLYWTTHCIMYCNTGEFGMGGGNLECIEFCSLYYSDLKTFMGCNAKVHLCPFHVSATGLNCLLRLAHW